MIKGIWSEEKKLYFYDYNGNTFYSGLSERSIEDVEHSRRIRKVAMESIKKLYANRAEIK